MFVKVTTSGPRRYVQLVESYRDDAGRVKKRTVATLGRLDQLTGELDSVIDGLLKVAGREPVIASSTTTPVGATAGVSFESARALGNVWTLTEIWKELGFSDLRRVFRRTRHTIDIEALIRIMVLNRLCDTDSKLGVLRWLQTVALADIDLKALTHQHLLRSMDALMDQQDALDDVVAKLLRPLVDQDLSVAFYDMTTIRAEKLTTMQGDVRKFGLAKEGLIARQFMLGVVQTSEGLPIYHEVFDDNTAETKTLLPILKKVMDRFPNLRRLILVADRGLLSLDNLEAHPKMPFSLCRITSRLAGMWLATSVDADAEVDDSAFGNVLRHAGGELVFATFLVGHGQGNRHDQAAFLKPPDWAATRSIFTICCSKMPGVTMRSGLSAPSSTNFMHRCHSFSGGAGHHRSKVARRHAVSQVAPAVALLGLNQRRITVNWHFEHVVLPVYLARFLGASIGVFGQFRAIAGVRKTPQCPPPPRGCFRPDCLAAPVRVPACRCGRAHQRYGCRPGAESCR